MCLIRGMFFTALVGYPGRDARLQALLLYYVSRLYTQDAIRGFLRVRHGIIISKRTLQRKLRLYNIRRNTSEAPVPEIRRTIAQCVSEGLCNLGYKSLWRYLNIVCGVRVRQETVRLILLHDFNQDVERRAAHCLRRRTYVNRGPNFLLHIDGYDKLKPFGFDIHGAIDGFSRKILWLKLVRSNKRPESIALLYLNFLKEFRCLPRAIRSDLGTENVILRDIHIALHCLHTESSNQTPFIAGRSTSNQRIEMFWSILSKQFTHFWRQKFKDMIDSGLYNSADPIQVECLRFCFWDILQTGLDNVKETWNTHRIRRQRHMEVPHGIPDVMYYQPETFQAVDFSLPLEISEFDIDYLAAEYCELPDENLASDFKEALSLCLALPTGDLQKPTTCENALFMYNLIMQIFDFNLRSI